MVRRLRRSVVAKGLAEKSELCAAGAVIPKVWVDIFLDAVLVVSLEGDK